MKHGSLFSGIGGFDLAAEWMGWENMFHCEWNPFGQKILKYYWPKAKSYDDITKTDFTIHRGKIDILTGGFPCQPYSFAGKRKGKEDERHLWPEMLRAIQEIAPSYVVGENVYGLVNWNDGLVFNEVQIDLENAGYEVQPYILPAASINAPHKRDRVWFVAYSHNNREGRRTRENESEGKKERLQERDQVQQFSKSNHLREISTYSFDQRCDNRSDNRQERQIHHNQNRYAQKGKSKRNGWKCRFSEISKTRHVTNANNPIKQRKYKCEQRQEEFNRRDSFSNKTNWKEFPTQAPICDGDDGLSCRLDSITFPKWRTESVKGAGNAIVPQVALQIFKTIESIETKL